MRQHNPFGEPLLIALLAVLFAMLLLAAMVFYRLSQPTPKEVAEYALYGTLFGVFTTGVGALIQALSRDPQTARSNAQAAATNAATIQASTPTAPPPVIVVPPVVPPPTEVTGPGGGPVQTEQAEEPR